ncbi:MAG: sigma-70 family RNA polymerase sigma factor [Bacteroidetes bacterium]|nr:sigma-70 family RNA polymerase sigma factor [Bacteroidota bacterium]
MLQSISENISRQLSDEEIVTRILAGQKTLFELIIRKYNSRLYRIGMSIVHDSMEVEDIMQTTYVKIYENLARLENRSFFGTWLTKIFINESLLQLKRKQRITSVSEINTKTEINNTMQIPVNAIINKELGKALEDALMQLPEKYRIVFVLREMEDMNVAETVTALGISAANVKTRLNRSKSMLREHLSSYYKNNQVFHFHLTRCDRIVDKVFDKLQLQRS